MSQPDDDQGNGAGNGKDSDEFTDEVTAVSEMPPEADELSDKLAKSERERGEAQDRMLRVAADFENYKKRVRREMDDASFRARESILKEILPVLDNLERANLAVQKGGSLESLAQGVKLVEKQLHGALEKFDVRGFDALGQPFDPARHEAIQQVERADVPAGAVAEVFARGYTMGERLLRAAMVAVAKGAPKTDDAPRATNGSGEKLSDDNGA